MKTFKNFSRMVWATVILVAFSTQIFAQQAYFSQENFLDSESLGLLDAKSAPALFAFNPDLQPPSPTNYEEVYTSIKYPQVAQAAQIEGQVQVRILVNESGKYEDHVVTASSSKVLSEVVEAELSNLEFQAATLHGEASPGWVSLYFKFRILP